MKKSVQASVAFLIGVAAAAVALADDSPAANGPAPSSCSVCDSGIGGSAFRGAVVVGRHAARSQLWSYQPVRSQEAPAVNAKKWVAYAH